MEIFAVNTAVPFMKAIGLLTLIISLIILAITAGLLIWNRGRHKIAIRTFSTVIITLVVIASVGGLFYSLSANGGSSTIIIGNNYVTISGQFIGNNTYHTSNISSAFVENIHTGNITLKNREMGTNFGSVNEGRYSLSNGARAYVISNNATDLVVHLNSGLYLVLGTSNTTLLAQSFSANVFTVNGIS